MNFFNKQELLKKRIELQQKKQKELKELIIKKKEEAEIILKYNSLQKPFQLKLNYNSIIPLHLYTCWHTKDLPPLMRENYELLVKGNPKIKFHLYDEDECRQFIQNNFENDVLEAYDNLIPSSYKSDLWRYCILYINGGIYMDIKYKCLNGFKFISLTEQEHFVRDHCLNDVYTALIVTLPNNEILKKCIYQIVENTKNKYYGNNSLSPTGPNLLGSYFNQDEKNSIDMYHSFTILENKINKYYIVKGDRIILTFYNDYREEQKKYQKQEHYSKFWDDKNIYKI
jgi:mannosyltransferase OCH1-like enzyme